MALSKHLAHLATLNPGLSTLDPRPQTPDPERPPKVGTRNLPTLNIVPNPWTHPPTASVLEYGLRAGLVPISLKLALNFQASRVTLERFIVRLLDAFSRTSVGPKHALSFFVRPQPELPRFPLCGATWTPTGWGMLTLGGLLRDTFSCWATQPSHGSLSVSPSLPCLLPKRCLWRPGQWSRR